MRKMLIIAAAFVGVLITHNVYAQNDAGMMRQGPVMQGSTVSMQNGPSMDGSGRNMNWQQMQGYHRQYAQNYASQFNSAPPDQPCGDKPTGECYCMYVHYEPCYYQCPRTVCEQIPCKRKCCRYVPQYYEVEKCRYVPQYYKETYCRQCPEYYYVDECKTCEKVVYDTKCEYKPCYYWKHSCGQPAASCGPQGCGPQGCGAVR